LTKSNNFRSLRHKKDQIIRYFIFFLTMTWLKEEIQPPLVAPLVVGLALIERPSMAMSWRLQRCVRMLTKELSFLPSAHEVSVLTTRPSLIFRITANY